MSSLRFGWRLLRREWRAGELRILALAVLVAAAAVSAVGFFTDRVESAMARQAGELLAADAVVESGSGLQPAWEEYARELGLRTARTAFFRTVVVAGDRLQLVEVKAAGASYPLLGTLRTAPEPFGEAVAAPAGPPRGEVWLEARLAALLGVEPGERVGLGRSEFLFSRVLVYEPDRGGQIFSIAPRLMMNLADVGETGLIQTGSLVTYRLLLAGDTPELDRFARWIRPQLGRGERLLGGREARPEVGSAIDRAERFLGLAALVSVMLAGVAAWTAAHRHARRHFDASALMRCLGAPHSFVLRAFLVQLSVLGLAAAAAGAAVGYAAQAVLATILAEFFAQALPPPSLWPWVAGVATGLVTLAGFAVPPLLSLRDVPPMRVLRRDLAPVGMPGVLLYGAALAALFGLMWWQARDLRLTVYVFGGALATVAVLGLFATLLVALLGPMRRSGGASWRFGLGNVCRRARVSRLQVAAFGLALTVLLLLSVVRGDLLEGWRESLPPDAPNHFLINVQQEQVAGIRQLLAERTGRAPGFYPMVKGRLVARNGEPIGPGDYENPRARRLVEREFNLSWATTLAPDNRVVAGDWWGGSPVDADHQWSVEEGIAETLGIAVGDRLRFMVSGRPVEGSVTSLRAVDWDSFRVNFFVLSPPGLLEGEPASYITSFFLPGAQKPVLADLVRQFPNVTVIDVDALMARVRVIIERVALAVEFVFAFTLAAGVVVLFAAIQTTRDERMREAALLRTLGATRRQVRAALAAEFLALGLLAGTLAGAAASLLGWLLAEYVFHIPYHPTPWPWIAGLLAGTLGVGAVGLLGTRRVLAHAPLPVLRKV